PQRSQRRRRADRVRGSGARPGEPSSDGRRAYGRARAHRIPHARILHDAPRAGLYARSAARSHLGRERVRRGAHDRRAHPPPAQGARGFRVRSLRADGSRLGVSLLRAHGVGTMQPATQAWGFAAVPNGVVILNAQREIVWFNRMAARLLNLRRTGDLGMRIENLLREPEFARYLARKDLSNPVVIRQTTPADSYLSLQVVPYGDG